ncbi:MAG: hypothetical protein AMXMBFR36_08930 [Acidobacteriota bacterium]
MAMVVAIGEPVNDAERLAVACRRDLKPCSRSICDGFGVSSDGARRVKGHPAVPVLRRKERTVAGDFLPTADPCRTVRAEHSEPDA